jgi:hypothetical protein
MATNYPTSLDSFTDPAGTDPLTSPDHAGQHTDKNDAVEALEAKVGVNSSAVSTSLDYQMENHAHTSGSDDGGTVAAANISIADAGNDFTATTVEGALDELQADNETHAAAADPHTGYVLESLYDAKGDIITASADNTPAKTTVGADDTILMADSGATGGVKWVASASPSAVSTAAATGTADTFTRGDHVHAHEAAHLAHDTAWAAKGDLAVGTANDTAAILTAGADGKVLQALASEATGLVWADASAGAALDVQVDAVSIEDPVDEINFTTGLDVTTPGAGRVVVAVDASELDHDAMGGTNTHDEDDLTPDTVLIEETLAITGIITPTDTGTQDDYNPSGMSAASVVSWSSSSAALTLNGIDPGPSGHMLWLYNNSAVGSPYTITLVDQAGTSTFEFLLPGEQNVVIPPKSGVMLYYKAATTQWILFGEGLPSSDIYTRSIYITHEQMTDDGASAVTAGSTGTPPDSMSHYAFDNTNTEGVNFEFMLPGDLDVNNPDLVMTMFWGTAGDFGATDTVRWRFNWLMIDDADSTVASGTSVTDDVDPGTTYDTSELIVTEHTNQVDSTGYTPGAALVRCNLSRLAATAGDDFASNVRLYGVKFEYTAEVPVGATGGGGAISLEDLDDVDSATPEIGDALVWDGTEWIPESSGTNVNADPFYGDGSDGAIDFDGTNTFGFTTEAGGAPTLSYTLDRPIWGTVITIRAGITVQTDSFPIFGRKLTIEATGILDNKGGNASGLTAGANSNTRVYGGKNAGATGRNDTVGVGASSSNQTLVPVEATTVSRGGSGGQAGAQAAGTAGTIGQWALTTGLYSWRHAQGIAHGRGEATSVAGSTWSTGSGGGAGSLSDAAGTTVSGGGGGSGGIIGLIVKWISNQGTITVVGGNGGTATTTSTGVAGGGGGGGGGIVFVACRYYTGNNPIVTGGSPGSGVGGAGAAAAGADGWYNIVKGP